MPDKQNRLSQSQHSILRLWVLGGIDAIGKHATTSIGPLIKQGYLDKTGPTEKARKYVDACEREDIANH